MIVANRQGGSIGIQATLDDIANINGCGVETADVNKFPSRNPQPSIQVETIKFLTTLNHAVLIELDEQLVEIPARRNLRPLFRPDPARVVNGSYLANPGDLEHL